DAPASAGGLQFGKALARSTFNCAAKTNSTQFGLQFPKPVNNAGTNDNTDTDVDGLINQLDCSRTDGTIQWAPIEVQHLTVAGKPTSTDSWDPQAAFVGTGVKYDEIRGSISLVASFTDASCNASGLVTSSNDDASVPADDAGYYYLVRANGGSGCVGTYGSMS